MKDTTKFKKVSVPAPDKIDLSKPVKGKGKATKGIKYNTSSSGVR